MIEILADFNKTDADRFLVLSRLAAHRDTPFQQIAESVEKVLLVDYADAVEGRLFYDAHAGHWLAVPDWDTQRRVRPDEDQPAVRRTGLLDTIIELAPCDEAHN